MHLNLEKCEKLFTDEFLHWLGPNPSIIDRNGIPLPCYRAERASHMSTSHNGLVCYGLSPNTTYRYASVTPHSEEDDHENLEVHHDANKYGQHSPKREQDFVRMFKQANTRHAFGSLDLSDAKPDDVTPDHSWGGSNSRGTPSAVTSAVFIRAQHMLRVPPYIVRKPDGSLRFQKFKEPGDVVVSSSPEFAVSPRAGDIVRRSGHDALFYFGGGSPVVAVLSTVGTYPLYKAVRPGVKVHAPGVANFNTPSNQEVVKRVLNKHNEQRFDFGDLDFDFD